MLRPFEWCRENVSLLTLSGSSLILASIHGLGIIYKNSYANYGCFKHRMAAVGIWMIIGDTANAMIYKSRYPIEPLFHFEKVMPEKNLNFIHETVETICADAVPCLTCSLYVHYDVALCGRFQLVLVKIAKEVDWFYKKVFRPKCPFWRTPFVEIFLAGNMVSFGLLRENNYVLMAAGPYQLATIFFNPGSYHSQKWNRTVYNFLMIPYVTWITQALCSPLKDSLV